jgi:DNA-binding cell septation regulator SpoVG
MPSNPSIVVTEIAPSHRKNAVNLASAVVQITFGEHVITVADCRVLEGKPGKPPWVALPSFSVPSGREWSYNPTITLSDGLRDQVWAAVLKAYTAWIQKDKSATKSGAFVNSHNVAVSNDDIPW